MAVAYTVVEDRRGRTNTVSAGQNYTYRRRFEVHVSGDDPARYGPIGVRLAFLAQTGIDVGSPYAVGVGQAWEESDVAAFAKSFEINCVDDDGCTWEVVVTYDEYDPDDWLPNPLDRRAKRSWPEVSTEAVADRGWNADGTPGPPVLNSAGDYFDPPVMRDRTRPAFTVVRNEALTALGVYPVYDPATAAAWRDTTNNAAIWGYAQYTIKCRSVAAEEAWSSKIPDGSGGFGAKYAVVTYSYEIDPDGWVARPLDQGFRYVSSGQRRAIVMPDGSQATSPVLLDGSGGVLAVGGTPVYGAHLVYRPRDFSAFGFTF